MSLVEVSLKNRVAEVLLNRPDKMNALSLQMIAELTQACLNLSTKVASDLSAVIVHSASSKAFCAGADLSERAKMSSSEVLSTLKKLRLMMSALESLPVPTLAVVEGIAFGGGLELSLCCDMRIFSKQAQVGLTETKLAIIPGAGGTQRLPQLVGMAKAKELIFRAARISAEEALLLGLANAVEEKPLEAARLWAQEIAENGPVAIRAAKQALVCSKTLDEGLDLEHEAYLKVLATNDRIEGLKAFNEKRKAQYQGN
jgi:methylglutaconyl-CoA hydratase